MIRIHRLGYGAVPRYSPCCFLLSIPLANSLFSLSPSYLLGIPLLVWCDPVHLGPRLLVNWPPSPFPPHSNFPTPRGFPKSTVRPTKTTSWSRLYIVRNMNWEMGRGKQQGVSMGQYSTKGEMKDNGLVNSVGWKHGPRVDRYSCLRWRHLHTSTGPYFSEP
jgi:hypothetical protein